MRKFIPMVTAGVAAVISGVVLNIYAIVPHYSILAYDSSTWTKLTSSGAREIPGGPEFLAIPPINYTMIAVGCGLIAIGMLLLIRMFSRKKNSSRTLSH